MNIDRLMNQLCIDEGVILKPYRDTVGKLTIGVGRNLDDRGISKKTAMQMLDEDITIALADLAFFLPWYKQLDAARQEALINMCFNLGIARLRGFKNMLAALQASDWQKAHDEALDSRWAKQVKQRAIRIATTFLTGEPLYANT